MKAIMRKVALYAVDAPNGRKKTIIKADLEAAIIEGAEITHYQRKKDYLAALIAYGFIEPANKAAFYFHEDRWMSSPLYAEASREIAQEIPMLEAVR